MNTEYHGGSVAGGTFPAEIWSDYMKQAKGKYCGDFKPAKTAAHFSPFNGKYARGGGHNTGDTKDAFGNSTAPTTPTNPAPTTPDTGKKDSGKFNPDLYESPPQEGPSDKPPASDDPAGGAEAPG
jgi:membrane peptidoglycan carboxypeptidase